MSETEKPENPSKPEPAQKLFLRRLKKIPKTGNEKKPKFKCIMCEQMFKSHKSLKEHFKRHGGGEIDIRGRPIEKSTLLKNPRQDTITLQLIPCDFCPEVLPNLSKAIQHKFRKHRTEGTNHFCEFCGKLFPIRVALEQHKESSQCGEKKVEPKATGNRVVPENEEPQESKCSFCPVTFATRSALEFHENCVHKFEKNLLFPIFIPPPSRKIKMSNSNEISSVYYCHLCGSEYILKYNLKKHLQNHHKEEERNQVPEEGIIKCKTCEAIFYTKKAYTAHNVHHKPGDLYVTSEEQRQQVVARVDLDFDIRRIPNLALPTERKRKPNRRIAIPSTSIKKAKNEKKSDEEPMSPPSSPSSSEDEIEKEKENASKEVMKTTTETKKENKSKEEENTETEIQKEKESKEEAKTATEIKKEDESKEEAKTKTEMEKENENKEEAKTETETKKENESKEEVKTETEKEDGNKKEAKTETVIEKVEKSA